MSAHPPVSSSRRGFTLMETVMTLSGIAILGGLVWIALSASLTLFSKNVSLNATHTALRTSLDRLQAELVQAQAMPTLINVDGSPAAAGASAAGVLLDEYRGGIYMVARADATGLPATISVLVARCAVNTNPANPTVPIEPPLPRNGDVLLFDGAAPTLRPRVRSATTNRAVTPQVMTITLQSVLGTALPFLDVERPARLVRRTAFLVRPANGRNQLRYYHTIEGVGNLEDAANFTVLTTEIGTGAGDATPFALTTVDGKPFVAIALRSQARSYDQALASRERGLFNTFMRIETQLRPRAE